MCIQLGSIWNEALKMIFSSINCHGQLKSVILSDPKVSQILMNYSVFKFCQGCLPGYQ